MSETNEGSGMSARRIHYTIYLTPEAWVALERHGYDPLLPPRGLPGPPGRINGATAAWVDGKPVHLPLRNHVCELDGIEVDGHETSDLNPGGECIHCGKEPSEWAGDE